VTRQRAFAMVALAFTFGAIFAYLPYKLHSIIWSRAGAGNALLQGSGFLIMETVALGVMAAGAFGAAGLCAIPLFERLSVGRAEYSRRYGPPKGGYNYPWRINQVNTFLFCVGPLVLIMTLWYLCDGYRISAESIVFRRGPFDSIHRSHWNQVTAIDADCLYDRNGFIEDFTLVTGKYRLSLGETEFEQYGDSVTVTAMKIAELVSRNNIRRINVYEVRGCHSPDISAIVKAAEPFSIHSRGK